MLEIPKKTTKNISCDNDNYQIDISESDLENKSCLYPLTRQQKGLWFDYKLNPDSNAYNTFLQITIKKGLDLEKFITAVDLVCKFVPTFRTRFVESNLGEVNQEIFNFYAKKDIVEFEDVSEAENMTIDKKYELALDKIKKKQSEVLRLELEDNHKVYLIKYSKDQYIFTISQHHIVADGISGILIAESIILAYNGGEDALRDRFKDMHYIKDYFLEYDKMSESIDLAKKYWKNKLANSHLVLDMQGRPNKFLMKQINFTLCEKRYDLIRKASRNNKTTSFIVLSALYGVLLYRYFRQKDILAAYPVNIRPRSFKDMFGYYVSEYPIRMQIDGNKSFSSFVQKLTAEQKEDRKNLCLTTDQIIDIVNGDNKLVNRDFNIVVGQSMFSGDDFLPKMLEVDSKIDFCPGFEVKDLGFLFDLQTKNLDCRLAYNGFLFSDSDAERFIENLKNLIDEILVEENDDLAIDDVDYIGKNEQEELLNKFNDTSAIYPKNKTIFEIFEDVAKKNPNQIAVICGDENITYKELDEKSDHLALYLQSLGVKIEDLVGICTQRSVEMIIGILGVMKSGAAYVPLDPSYPENRLEYILNDSAVKILLTEKSLKKKVGELKNNNLKIISLEEVFKLENNQKKPKSLVNSDNLAYIIYTSGSTGNPKGVMIEHEGFVNMVLDQIKNFAITKKDNCLQFASQGFDASVYEIFMALFSGASLVIASNEVRADKKLFSEYLKDHNVSVATLTPSFLKSQARDAFPTLKTIITAGEAADFDDAIFYVKNGKKYINAYGPTESSVCASFYEVKEEDKLKNTLPIGCPISNIKIYILDKNNKPLPIGVYGELHIAGEGLARGYLNRDDLTKEKFIQNPFATKEDNKKGLNQRLYKSGDLARWLEDGNIEYLGRIDTQVKIRGFRIELGEIENCLNKYQKVKEAVIVVKGEGDCKKLVAYYTLNSDDKEVSNIEFKVYLKKYLPEYMVPDVFVMLKKIPLNSNGKTDRKLLTDKDISISKVKKYKAPKSAIEKVLTKIFIEVLDLDKNLKIGIEDSFFELGGHSLLAIKLVNLIKIELGKEINLSILFQHPTIKELSLFCEDKDKLTLPSDSNLIALQSKGKADPIFCVPGIGGSSIYFVDLVNFLGKKRPCYGLNYPGYSSEDKSYDSIEDLARDYISLIKNVQKTGPYYLLGHSFGALIAFEMAYQLESEKEIVHVLDLDGRLEIIEEIKREFKDKKFQDEDLELVMILLKILENFEDIKVDQESLKKTLGLLSIEERYEFIRLELEKHQISISTDYIIYLSKVIASQIRMNYRIGNKKINNMTFFKAKKPLKDNRGDYNPEDWKKHVANLKIISAKGNHFAMLKNSNAKDLAKKIREVLV